MRIRCEHSVLDTLVAHTLKSYPNEACGLLEAATTGTEWTVLRAIPCANLAADPQHHFDLDPVTFLAAEASARTRRQRIVGLYHSHPAGPGFLSYSDRTAAWSGSLQILCDLSDRDRPILRAWRLQPGAERSQDAFIECGAFVPADWSPATGPCLRQRS